MNEINISITTNVRQKDSTDKYYDDGGGRKLNKYCDNGQNKVGARETEATSITGTSARERVVEEGKRRG